MRNHVAAALLCGFFVLGPQSLAAESDSWIQQLLDSVNLHTIIGINNESGVITRDISGTGGGSGVQGTTGKGKKHSNTGGELSRDISGTGGL